MRMIRFLLILSLLLHLSCSENDNELQKPEGVMSDSAFTELLVDFAMAESAANMNILNLSLNKLDSAYAFDPLKEHGLTREQYETTIRYYSSHPVIYSAVYENVLARLSEIAARPSVKAASDSL